MALTKKDINELYKLIQEIYLSDKIPWICGYSGGKDSTAIVQLVWNAIGDLSLADRNRKKIYVINTDTLVESPVVSVWAKSSLNKMRNKANEQKMPIYPQDLTPKVENTYWVNLIGRGYPYPRKNFRWCTDRLKIEPSNSFIKKILDAESEAILVLGTRKAESSSRRDVMETYEKKQYRAHLSPNGSFPNSYVFSPIENWSNDEVWQYLMQYENPWGHSNKELLAMYSGASSDGECPLVIDTSTPSCGNSRFGCWVCTLVPKDRSMDAMIKNDEEKSWMLPLMQFRDYLASDHDTDWGRRDFRRMGVRLTWQRGHLVHGPYTKEVREDFLRGLLELEQYIQANGPSEIRDIPLITIDELKFIRKIWLNEKHEFDDSLPVIYQQVTGKSFEDDLVLQNKYYMKDEWEMLRDICVTKYQNEELLTELETSLLDIVAKSATMSRRHNIMQTLERQITKCFYKNEDDALSYENARRERLGLGIDDSQER